MPRVLPRCFHALRRARHSAWFVLLLSAFFISGCKTSEDAQAASAQLTATAQALSEYYAALDTMLVETDQLYAVKAILIPAAVYDQAAKDLLAESRTEIAKREQLADALTTVAASFGSLTGSTAAADVPASATA